MSPPSDDDTVALGRGAGADTRAEATLPVRARIAGRYEIVELLGQGGMGAVYLALDEALGGKPIALKVVGREVSSEAALAELRGEVVLAQRVTHRNVCRIYDLEQLDGRWTIKMECVAGETLAERIARGRLTIDQAVAIATQIAAGLGAAHEQGVIHRDLKPGNVMIEEGSGRVVLMDFGIARRAGTDDHSDGAGTPAYMAPEQLRGEPVDARCDVYALGCVLFHMLVGTVAFPATSTDAGLRRIEEPVPDPRAQRPDLPAWLARAIVAMLDRDRDRRPRDAAEVVRLLAGPRWRARAPVIAGAGVAVAGAVAAIALTSRPAPRPALPSAWTPAIREIEPSYDENVDSIALSPDGTRLASSTDRERPGWLRGRVLPLAGGDEIAVTPPEMNVLMMSWTHDGRSLLFTDAASGMGVYRMPATGGAPERIGEGYAIGCGPRILRFEFGAPGCPHCPRFVLREDDGREREVLRLDHGAFVTTYRCDRAGERVVWSRAEQGAPFYQPADLWIADLATGTPRQLTHDRARNAYPTFTPDGRSVVFTSARGGGVMNLWELPLDGGAPRQLTFGNGNDILPDVSPDGRFVVFDVDVTSAPLYAYAGPGAARARVTPSRAILIGPQVTPDGREVVATDFAPLTPRIVAVRLDDGAVRGLAEGVLASVTPDGREVVLARDGVPAVIAAVPLAGGTARTLGQVDGRVRALRAGPDGAVHVMVDRGTAIEAWRVPPDGEAPVREADAPWCFVQPAPAGGWSLWMRCAGGAPTEGVLVAPGATPDPAAPGLRMRGPMFFGGDFDARGATLLLYDQPRVMTIDVATGAITPQFDAALLGATLSPDGATIYTSEATGRARRHLLTNFADRPRR
ncbi:MAG TPA: protein kinase [Kofleriaceae bacterium]|nr:protein kinase [Kofleriaceae bacterium]